MPTVLFVSVDGTERAIKAEVGLSVMEVATRNGVPGVNSDCGGACACATCHVYIRGDWAARIPPPDATEREMIEFADHSTEDSRLSCQIKLTPELDGLQVDVVPE